MTATSSLTAAVLTVFGARCVGHTVQVARRRRKPGKAALTVWCAASALVCFWLAVEQVTS